MSLPGTTFTFHVTLTEAAGEGDYVVAKRKRSKVTEENVKIPGGGSM